MSAAMADMREQLAADERTSALISAMRGTNINDDDNAASGTTLQVVEMRAGDDSLPTEYDPAALSAYFRKRPGAVLTRIGQLALYGGAWVAKTLLSALRGELTSGSEGEVAAVAGLRDVLVSLGPFYIKLGQALSIRPDILSPQAMVQLQQLCDKVPPFESAVAMQCVRDELGVEDVSELFSTITPEPVAAASLGQVYKATLREGGDEVAVKVQRPFVLETVSLDLHLARAAGQFLRKMSPEASQRVDVVSLLDEFAANFYRELDYVLECENGIRIARDMRRLPRVKIPANYPQLTSRRVHTAEWVDGEKLSQSTADDVGELVNLGVITYLTQLLDTGFFHADPHPGNMLRTPEGRLVILDFGLMTEVTDDQKYGMIEAIAHLINRDYSLIGEDFKNMDFIPRDVDTAPIVPALSKVFDVALAGGGAKSINFQELAADLAEITYEFPFRIPPYSALIIRAISVLEGIALVGNPQFAIIDEAYPYLSRKLLTDDSPRMREALRYMVYGEGKTFDVDRVIDLLQALEKFSEAQAQASTAREAVGFFFSDDGQVFRDFLVDEVVAAADALSREALQNLILTAPGRALDRLPQPRFVRAFNREVRDALAPKPTESDEKVLSSIRRLLDFFLGDLDAAGTDPPPNSNSPAVLRSLVPDQAARARAVALLPILRENQQDMRAFGLTIVGRLAELQTGRALGLVRSRIGAQAKPVALREAAE
ncbi:hypothetical protein EMIHUDRAFT_427260, partial [Emiliania huxleyi CCMP1516]|uniref:Protein kinase domain-containing protein n=2 Tax=Emiliania huxleyi TaxID=2903 RepID=A0A0D3JAF0_EMIH1